MSVETVDSLNRIGGSVDDDHYLTNLPIMSKAELNKVALEHGGYSTPYLNDTLYLHSKGYQRIENLEEYSGLKSLWLHSNGFSKIENVNTLKELRCLFLQNNAFTKIENLEGLMSLIQLDLSENNITRVEGLSGLTCLKTLNLSKNLLKDTESIRHLTECKELSALDLSKNELSGEDIIDCLAGISSVMSINMAGNPVVSKVAYFRKKLIVGCKLLRYLDRPIFENERASAEAWAEGGPDAERETKERLHRVKRDKERNSLLEFRAWQESVRRSHGVLPQDQIDAMIPPPLMITDEVQSAVNEDIDDRIIPPPLLIQTRPVDAQSTENTGIVSVDEMLPLPSSIAVDDMIPPLLPIEPFSDNVHSAENVVIPSVDGLDEQLEKQLGDKTLADMQNKHQSNQVLNTTDDAIKARTSDSLNDVKPEFEQLKIDHDNGNMCSLS